MPSGFAASRSVATASGAANRSPRCTHAPKTERRPQQTRSSPPTRSRTMLHPRRRSCSRRSPEPGGYARTMPELPEVETVRARLAPVLTGRRLERVDIADSRLTRPFDPRAVAAELEGERVAAVDRRGKYLVVRFESG